MKGKMRGLHLRLIRVGVIRAAGNHGFFSIVNSLIFFNLSLGFVKLRNLLLLVNQK